VKVPLGAMGVALVSCLMLGTHDIIWSGALGVAVVSLICGTILAFYRPAPADAPQAVAKPAFDRDAYEFVNHHS
jgi:hypothetical protein